MALRFSLSVKDVRAATEDEIEHEHAHGAEGLEIVDEDDDDEEGGEPKGHTLH
jgi:FKBP-type peptidyl-prolyl cis-trans isomerase SlyD